MSTAPPGAATCPVRSIHPEAVADARAHLDDERTYVHLATLFGALSDATRVRIVHALARQELCTCDLAAVAGISESGTSQHLRILRALGLVTSRRAGKVVYYRLDDDHVEQLVRIGLAHLGHEESGTRGRTTHTIAALPPGAAAGAQDGGMSVAARKGEAGAKG